MESTKDVEKNVEVNEYQKALDEIKNTKVLIHMHDDIVNEIRIFDEDDMNVEILQKLVDKEKPKKPTKAKDGSYKNWASYGLCPNCESVRIHDYEYDRKFNRCSDCGQVIDWSKDE